MHTSRRAWCHDVDHASSHGSIFSAVEAAKGNDVAEIAARTDSARPGQVPSTSRARRSQAVTRPEDYGPILMAARKLGEEWSEVRDELIELSDSMTLEPDRCVIDAEYLLTTGTKASAG
jgi:hypothetical protein